LYIYLDNREKVSEMAEMTAAGWTRQNWMSLLAQAPAARVDALARPVLDGIGYSVLRAPECGTIMARGRAGATGTPFNLGEVTVVRASIRLEDGVVGHGYVQGRDRTHAVQSALLDALMQTDAAERVGASVLRVLADERQADRTARAAKAAATKVDFFTLARGEDR
jgi:alpha-D-ribose 1-methylphosphonate 5-triphosphate synthase subunit PhnG